MRNKIYDGPFDDRTFQPANKTGTYKHEPVSIFDYDPMEVGVESLSLHERTRDNVRKNPVVVEGFGKIDYYKKKERPGDVDNSNRVVPGDPNSIKSQTSDQQNTIMTPEDALRYSGPLQSESGEMNSAQQIVMNGKPMVWRQSGGVLAPTTVASTNAVNNVISSVKDNCDNVRAPQDWKAFQRSAEEQKNLASSAIPFEPWNANKVASAAGLQKFDPSKPYRPAQVDFNIGALPEPVQQAVAHKEGKTFNRTAKPFGK